MGKTIFRLVFMLALNASVFPFQSSAGAIFLLIPPSSTINGLGGIGVCLPSDDPYSGYFNPANGLNLFEGVSYSHSKMVTPWLEALSDEMYFHYEVWNIGVIPKKYPIKFVASLHRTLFDLGQQSSTDEFGNTIGIINSYMNSTAMTLGIGYRGDIKKVPINLAIGYTRKTVSQSLLRGTKAINDFSDYGLLLSLPVQFKFSPIKKVKTFTDRFRLNIMPAFGYSVSNVGDDVFFLDPGQADPSPKYLRTGISATVSISYKSDWHLLRWKGGRAASDILIKDRSSGDDPIKYQNGLGDVNFVNNVIKNETDSSITIHRGDEWTFLDIYTIRRGREIDVSGKIDIVASGYGYSLNGLIKLLSILVDDPIYEMIPQYIDIQYNYALWEQYIGHPLHLTEFKSLTITFNNIDQLLMRVLQ